VPTLEATSLISSLAAVQWESPLFWALLIGWIMTVVLHEFAHGVVAHLGGDYTIRERGGLTLNPFQYIDPLNSIAFPALFLIMGGIPLPGGVTFIREDLLRSNAWRTAVALAGPASNFLIFLGCLVVLHPALGIFDLSKPVGEWSNGQVFVAALGALQIFSVILNLIPWPGLDGFGAIAPYLPDRFVEQTRQPAVRFVCLLAFVFLIARLPLIGKLYGECLIRIPPLLGLPRETGLDLLRSLQTVLWGA
jgi:Zn-dependent protease